MGKKIILAWLGKSTDFSFSQSYIIFVSLGMKKMDTDSDGDVATEPGSNLYHYIRTFIGVKKALCI